MINFNKSPLFSLQHQNHYFSTVLQLQSLAENVYFSPQNMAMQKKSKKDFTVFIVFITPILIDVKNHIYILHEIICMHVEYLNIFCMEILISLSSHWLISWGNNKVIFSNYVYKMLLISGLPKLHCNGQNSRFLLFGVLLTSWAERVGMVEYHSHVSITQQTRRNFADVIHVPNQLTLK